MRIVRVTAIMNKATIIRSDELVIRNAPPKKAIPSQNMGRMRIGKPKRVNSIMGRNYPNSHPFAKHGTRQPLRLLPQGGIESRSVPRNTDKKTRLVLSDASNEKGRRPSGPLPSLHDESDKPDAWKSDQPFVLFRRKQGRRPLDADLKVGKSVHIINIGIEG